MWEHVIFKRHGLTPPVACSIGTAFAATKQHAKLTPLIAPPTMTTYHHHGAGFYLQSVLFSPMFYSYHRRFLSSTKNAPFLMRAASSSSPSSAVSRLIDHTRRRSKTLSTVPDHRGCRRVVTSKQPAHQGHLFCRRWHQPSTIDVNQHTLAPPQCRIFGRCISALQLSPRFHPGPLFGAKHVVH